MRKKIQYCVLHAPTTVGGNPQGLNKSLQMLGVCSFSLTFQQNYFQYPADHVLWSLETPLIVKEIRRLLCILSMAFQYKIIHYNFGTTIANPFCPDGSGKNQLKKLAQRLYALYRYFLCLFELNLYSILGKKMFVTYQGSDARQNDYCLKSFKFSIASQLGKDFHSKESDNFKRDLIKVLKKFCYKVYSLNPDLLYVLPENSQFIPYSHVQLDEWIPNYSQFHDQTLCFCHAPSNRKVKGTKIILDTVDRLRNNGYKINLTLVEGKTNEEARKIYEKADIIIDQIFAGWYGGLAVEAMALGKPVMVYIREEDLQFIPKEMANDLPFIRINSENLGQKLIEVLAMPRQDLLALAKQSRAFVEKWHDPIKIASQIKQDYEAALKSS